MVGLWAERKCIYLGIVISLAVNSLAIFKRKYYRSQRHEWLSVKDIPSCTMPDFVGITQILQYTITCCSAPHSLGASRYSHDLRRTSYSKPNNLHEPLCPLEILTSSALFQTSSRQTPHFSWNPSV